jgi:hypothetical protein
MGAAMEVTAGYVILQEGSFILENPTSWGLNQPSDTKVFQWRTRHEA